MIPYNMVILSSNLLAVKWILQVWGEFQVRATWASGRFAAGLIQANVGLNLVFHNTQWVVALHAHTFLLTGVGTMLFSVLYALVPMLTKLEFKSKKLVEAHFWLWMAGSQGMLRHTFYEGSQFQGYTLVAIIGGLLVSAGLVAFLVNTIGLKNALSLFAPAGGHRTLKEPAPDSALAQKGTSDREIHDGSIFLSCISLSGVLFLRTKTNVPSKTPSCLRQPSLYLQQTTLCLLYPLACLQQTGTYLLQTSAYL